MNNFIPDIYQKNIFTIDYQKLKDRGIKCLIFDLDNRLAPLCSNKPCKELKELFAHLNDFDFKMIILSNSGQKRVSPFKEELNIDSAYRACKPFSFKYKKILKIYKYQETEVACIGDQILTDIYGANKMGFTSIFVEQLTPDTFIGTKINRFFERIILNSLRKRGIYERGKYYD
ncbi:MAG: YqeG family HAD IIIA-type phosphatase [Erysipelotrichaceae bacterium]